MCINFFPLSVTRSDEPTVGGKIILPAIKLNRFTNHTTSYTIKNPSGELFTYTPNGKVRIPSSVELKTELYLKKTV